MRHRVDLQRQNIAGAAHTHSIVKFFHLHACTAQLFGNGFQMLGGDVLHQNIAAGGSSSRLPFISSTFIVKEFSQRYIFLAIRRTFRAGELRTAPATGNTDTKKGDSFESPSLSCLTRTICCSTRPRLSRRSLWSNRTSRRSKPALLHGNF